MGLGIPQTETQPDGGDQLGRTSHWLDNREASGMLWFGTRIPSHEERKLLGLHPISKLLLGTAYGVGCSTEAVERKVQPTMEESQKLQNETVTKLRTLAHDLSNSIETIMQASYLLVQAKLDDNNGKWLDLIEKAAQDAARINREIREILRSQS